MLWVRIYKKDFDYQCYSDENNINRLKSVDKVEEGYSRQQVHSVI